MVGPMKTLKGILIMGLTIFSFSAHAQQNSLYPRDPVPIDPESYNPFVRDTLNPFDQKVYDETYAEAYDRILEDLLGEYGFLDD